MNNYIRLITISLVLSIVTTSVALSQTIVQFKKMITFSVADSPQTDSITIGVNSGNPSAVPPELESTYMPDATEEFGVAGHWKELMLAPGYCQGPDFCGKIFDVRPGTWTWPQYPYSPIILTTYDFRGYTAADQVDSFYFCLRVGVLTDYESFPPSGITMTWPADLGAYGTRWELLRRTSTTPGPLGTFIHLAEMVGTTGITDIGAADSNEVRYLIIKTGAFMPIVQFKKTITFSCEGAPAVDSVVIGVNSGNPAAVPPEPENTYMPDEGSEFGIRGMWQESHWFTDLPHDFYLETPILDVRPGTWPAGWKLNTYDFRGYNASNQIDSFLIWVIAGPLLPNAVIPPSGLILSWSANLSANATTWQLKRSTSSSPSPLGTFVEVLPNMATAGLSFTDVGAANQTQVRYLIIKTGAFMPPPGPFIALDPTSLNFGIIAEGTVSTLPVTISNAGATNPLIISSCGFPYSCYSLVESLPITVGPNSSTTIHITFEGPVSGGTFNGDIIFTHNASGGTTVLPVTGRSYNQETSTLLDLSSGWNLVSVPRVQTDYTASAVFSGSYGSMFRYDASTGDYAEAPTLQLGLGYWVYYPSSTVVNISGSKPCPIIVPCLAGWNLIGSCPDPIDVGDIILSQGSIFGAAFTYNPTLGDYVETATIQPGQATWIYLTQSCDLTLPCECE